MPSKIVFFSKQCVSSIILTIKSFWNMWLSTKMLSISAFSIKLLKKSLSLLHILLIRMLCVILNKDLHCVNFKNALP